MEEINSLLFILSGISSECQTAWIQNVGPDLGPNCLQRLSACADVTSRQGVKEKCITEDLKQSSFEFETAIIASKNAEACLKTQ